jgi:hypothetical protein
MINNIFRGHTFEHFRWCKTTGDETWTNRVDGDILPLQSGILTHTSCQSDTTEFSSSVLWLRWTSVKSSCRRGYHDLSASIGLIGTEVMEREVGSIRRSKKINLDSLEIRFRNPIRRNIKILSIINPGIRGNYS